MKIAIDLQAAQTPSSRHRGIGRASLALVQAMVRNPRAHDIHILGNEAFYDTQMSLRSALPELPPNRWHWFSSPTNPEHGRRPLAEIGERFRERAIARLDADLVHVTSMFEGLGDAARTSIGSVPGLPLPMSSVTLYDLIPYLRPDPYLLNPDVRTWYYRKLASLRRADLLLAISDYAREEAIEALELDAERVVSISCGADPLFRPKDWDAGEREALMARYDLLRPYVMYTGGDDERKNLKGLIAAWAAVPDELRQQHHLLIVCRLSDMRRIELRQYASELGMGGDELVLPGTFVPDEDLRALYAACALFVFPSLHEGFGLPVLEAMCCGAPVIAANTSSLPEVLGRPDALFDPTRLESIRDAMVQTLSDPGRLASLREHAPGQASKFSWEISAERALDGFEMAYERRRFEATPRIAVPRVDSQRIAFWPGTPLDEAAITESIDALSTRFQIDVVSEETPTGDLGDRFAWRTPDWVRSQPTRYVSHVHMIGTGDTYTELGERLAEYPGVTLLGSLVDLATPAPRDFETLFRLHGWRAAQLVKEHGVEAAAARLPGTMEEFTRLPALYVANDSMYQQMVTWFGQRVADTVPVLSQLGPTELFDAVVRAASAEPRPPAPYRLRSLYVDITMLTYEDLRTGIQRVVRAVVAALPDQLPPGWTVVPVRAHGARGYLYADALLARWLDLPVPESVIKREGQEVTPLAGDQFLGLDWVPQLTVDSDAHLADWRARGVRINFVVYDLLPVLAPNYFPAEVVDLCASWLSVLGKRADGLVAISHAVADELQAWYADHPIPSGGSSPSIGWFRLGADIEASLPTDDPDPVAMRALDALAPGRLVMSVGTVEPRKGYDEALAAFERLWAEGVDINWVLVGHAGWHTEALIERLRSHPEAGSRLLWLEQASDAVLADVYRRAELLLVPSRGEGFGLPLIEGARHGVPLLVRNLPVFHEVAGTQALYFDSTQQDGFSDLTQALRQWSVNGVAPRPAVGIQTWAGATRDLLSVILDQRWEVRPANLLQAAPPDLPVELTAEASLDLSQDQPQS